MSGEMTHREAEKNAALTKAGKVLAAITHRRCCDLWPECSHMLAIAEALMDIQDALPTCDCEACANRRDVLAEHRRSRLASLRAKP